MEGGRLVESLLEVEGCLMTRGSAIGAENVHSCVDGVVRLVRLSGLRQQRDCQRVAQRNWQRVPELRPNGLGSH